MPMRPASSWRSDWRVPAREPISLRRYRVSRLLGLELQDEVVTGILERLGLTVVHVPAYSLFTDPLGAAALEAAVLEEDLTQLDDGLETTIGSRGVKLSGGQKQRIAM